jgi:hypothetical protein
MVRGNAEANQNHFQNRDQINWKNKSWRSTDFLELVYSPYNIKTNL